MTFKTVNKKAIFGFLTLIIILGLSAFFYLSNKSNGSSKPLMTEKDLRASVIKLWDAKKVGDNRTIYSFADEKYRNKISESQFLKKNIKPVLSYEIENIEINTENKTAIVKVKFKTVHLGFEFNPTLNEKWVYDDGWMVNLSESASPI